MVQETIRDAVLIANFFFTVVLGLFVYRVRKSVLHLQTRPNIDAYITRDPVEGNIFLVFKNWGPIPIRRVKVKNRLKLRKSVLISDGYIPEGDEKQIQIPDNLHKRKMFVELGDKVYLPLKVYYSTSLKKRNKMRINR